MNLRAVNRASSRNRQTVTSGKLSFSSFLTLYFQKFMTGYFAPAGTSVQNLNKNSNASFGVSSKKKKTNSPSQAFTIQTVCDAPETFFFRLKKN